MTQIADRPARPDETLAVAVSDITQSLTMVQAINRALYDAMAADERVLVFGEDVAVEGGVFRVTEGLADTFGADRCFDTPLAESAIIGIAVGLALRGFVPVPEIQFDGFSYPAFDQVVSHLAKYRTRTRGEVDMPVTVRIPRLAVSVRPNIIRTPRSPTGCTPRASRWWCRRHPVTLTGCCGTLSPARTP